MPRAPCRYWRFRALFLIYADASTRRTTRWATESASVRDEILWPLLARGGVKKRGQLWCSDACWWIPPETHYGRIRGMALRVRLRPYSGSMRPGPHGPMYGPHGPIHGPNWGPHTVKPKIFFIVLRGKNNFKLVRQSSDTFLGEITNIGVKSPGSARTMWIVLFTRCYLGILQFVFSIVCNKLNSGTK